MYRVPAQSLWYNPPSPGYFPRRDQYGRADANGRNTDLAVSAFDLRACIKGELVLDFVDAPRDRGGGLRYRREPDILVAELVPPRTWFRLFLPAQVTNNTVQNAELLAPCSDKRVTRAACQSLRTAPHRPLRPLLIELAFRGGCFDGARILLPPCFLIPIGHSVLRLLNCFAGSLPPRRRLSAKSELGWEEQALRRVLGLDG